MLAKLPELKKSKKWGVILDANGNVGNFMKYKAGCYYSAWLHLSPLKKLPIT